MKTKNEKVILVDAYHCLFTENGINRELQKILDSFPNRKIVLTNADDEQMMKFGIDKSPYEVFTLKHNPNKTDRGYYEKMLEHYNLKAEDCIYIEHNKDAITQAEKVGIKSFYYKNNEELLEEFIKENISKKRRINIYSGSNNKIATVLSNLADTPFEYGGYRFASVESALQGIKFADKKEREKIFKLSGKDALKIGRRITESLSINSNKKYFVYWKDKKILFNSDEHRLLLAAFLREKIRQNKEVINALLETKDYFIYHDVGEESPNTSLPEKFYIEILLSERRILERLKKVNLLKVIDKEI